MEYNDTIVGQVYDVVVQHWYTKGKRNAQLIKVEEDDQEWRDLDGDELSYDWDVISYVPSQTKATDKLLKKLERLHSE
jgi:hypothetical protein